MAKFKVTGPDGKTYEVNAPKGSTRDDAIAYVKNEFYQDSVSNTVAQGAKDLIGGAVRGAGSIGSTIIAPYDIAKDALNGKGLSLESNNARREKIDSGLTELIGSNPENDVYKVGKIGAEIAGTAAVGGALGKLPMLSKIAPALESGGLSLGSAATGSKVANGLIRTGAGALTGATQAGMVDPSSTGTGALIGGILPGGVSIAGAAGRLVNDGAKLASRKLMQSALKPSSKAVKTGAAAKAIDAMLENGISVTQGGFAKTQSMIDDLNTQIANKIGSSTAQINKADIIPYLDDVKVASGMSPSHAQDMAKISEIESGFNTMPAFPGGAMTPLEAQNFKQAMYQRLKDSYGQMGSVETEANKALARGAKEQIAAAVPDIAPLNAKESGLIEAQKLLAQRLAVAGNKDPMGLAALILSDPKAAAAFMLNRSEFVKSLAARGINSASNGASSVVNRLPSSQYGLLGAPAVLSANH